MTESTRRSTRQVNMKESQGNVDDGGGGESTSQAPSKRAKTGRRMRIISPAPGTDDSTVPQSGAAQPPTDTSGDNGGSEKEMTGHGESDNDEGGEERVKNKFIDDEAEEDDEGEDEDGEKAHPDAIEDLGVAIGGNDSDDEDMVDLGAGAHADNDDSDSDGEHSAYSSANHQAPGVVSGPEAVQVHINGLQPAAQYFRMFVLDKKHPVYLAIKADAITKYYGVNPYLFAQGVYNAMHTYDEIPLFSTSAYRPENATDYPDPAATLEKIYPQFDLLRTLATIVGFREGAGYINLSRMDPARLLFMTMDRRSRDTSLVTVADKRTPVMCLTGGLVRDFFVGPEGRIFNKDPRRGISIAPLDGEPARIFACLNEVAKFTGEDHHKFPLYDNGSVAFSTKPGKDGRKPNVPGYPASAKAKREKPELISDGSKNFRKAGVLEYMDEIPVIDARSKAVDWGVDTLKDLKDERNWPRFVGMLDRDALAVVFYTVSRWQVDQKAVSFNIDSIVVLSDSIDAESSRATKALKEVEKEALARKKAELEQQVKDDAEKRAKKRAERERGKRAKALESSARAEDVPVGGGAPGTDGDVAETPVSGRKKRLTHERPAVANGASNDQESPSKKVRSSEDEAGVPASGGDEGGDADMNG
ncbi:uncharacterized protein SCHCODRAFT_02519799 [Schizophyllum commune H4-8]|nr:uncharacterized protein SCHCODRAFT_02519799 [Schizophyllum commune H4-8]KAI5885603.1 hypothetical protein SCHCODRAFT_02519799 [Schizophyllum commune H4-8]